MKHGVETWIEVTIILVNLDTGGYNKSWDSNIAAWVVLINLNKNVLVEQQTVAPTTVFALILLSQIPNIHTRDLQIKQGRRERKITPNISKK